VRGILQDKEANWRKDGVAENTTWYIVGVQSGDSALRLIDVPSRLPTDAASSKALQGTNSSHSPLGSAMDMEGARDGKGAGRRR